MVGPVEGVTTFGALHQLHKVEEIFSWSSDEVLAIMSQWL